jgi:hypothetical protein
MRHLTQHRKRRTVHLGDMRSLRHQLYTVDGRRHMLEHASWHSDGTVHLTLIEEAVFVEQNELREQRRRLAGLLTRWRRDNDAEREA